MARPTRNSSNSNSTVEQAPTVAVKLAKNQAKINANEKATKPKVTKAQVKRVQDTAKVAEKAAEKAAKEVEKAAQKAEKAAREVAEKVAKEAEKAAEKKAKDAAKAQAKVLEKAAKVKAREDAKATREEAKRLLTLANQQNVANLEDRLRRKDAELDASRMSERMHTFPNPNLKRSYATADLEATAAAEAASRKAKAERVALPVLDPSDDLYTMDVAYSSAAEDEAAKRKRARKEREPEPSFRDNIEVELQRKQGQGASTWESRYSPAEEPTVRKYIKPQSDGYQSDSSCVCFPLHCFFSISVLVSNQP
ncbi:hypothetical protein NEOLEDRAFT_1184397 [Neolentinus lepideus HHB14362 ss-1]|uniref:Uncharacterized protein n=1 Tax=Neolentinus lepideus HHB14362 ss-1 TaxID=1314782 RepID=A0A165MG76_9AGAM|nr:hypothetical protein NEOLEDRAFT_1184397 [Neolentinus lepideus HHB14362 ss-1]